MENDKMFFTKEQLDEAEEYLNEKIQEWADAHKEYPGDTLDEQAYKKFHFEKMSSAFNVYSILTGCSEYTYKGYTLNSNRENK